LQLFNARASDIVDGIIFCRFCLEFGNDFLKICICTYGRNVGSYNYINTGPNPTTSKFTTICT
jgi:hypothetical protein